MGAAACLFLYMVLGSPLVYQIWRMTHLAQLQAASVQGIGLQAAMSAATLAATQPAAWQTMIPRAGWETRD